MGIEDLGTLNLADADLTAGDFDPIPSGSYTMHVHEVTAVEIEKDTGKLPMGTPGYNIQLRVDEGPHANRVVFKRYYLPGDGYDAEKRKKSLGMFANFLIALGYAKEDVMSGSFQTDPVDWIGKQCKVSVKKVAAVMDEDTGDEKYAAKNEVQSIKPLNAAAVAGAAGVL
jgi:hypothetical protein